MISCEVRITLHAMSFIFNHCPETVIFFIFHRLRWTALHSCVIGLAELRSRDQRANRAHHRNPWNETDKLNGTKGNMTRTINTTSISQAASSALGFVPAKDRDEKNHVTIKLGNGSLPKHIDVLILLLKVSSQLVKFERDLCGQSYPPSFSPCLTLKIRCIIYLFCFHFLLMHI